MLGCFNTTEGFDFDPAIRSSDNCLIAVATLLTGARAAEPATNTVIVFKMIAEPANATTTILFNMVSLPGKSLRFMKRQKYPASQRVPRSHSWYWSR